MHVYNNCVFSNLSSSGNGGAINIGSYSNEISFYFCMFAYCSASFNGGAIYCSSQGDVFRMKRVCGFYCYSNSVGNVFPQFSHVLLTSKAICEIEHTSILLCSPFYGHSIAVIRVEYGNQTVTNTNSSNNRLARHSAIDMFYSKKFLIDCSSFVNNTSSEWTALQFYLNDGLIYMSNIIGNNSPNSRGVFLFADSHINVDNCCILKNLNTLFDNRNKDYFTIRNSIIDSLTYIGYLPLTTSITSTTSNFHTLNLYQSGFCKAESPLRLGSIAHNGVFTSNIFITNLIVFLIV